MLHQYLIKQNQWSDKTFPNKTPLSIIKHIRLEIVDIRLTPLALVAWINIIILSFDGMHTLQYIPKYILEMLQRHLTQNRFVYMPPLDILRKIEHELKVLEVFPYDLSRWVWIVVLAFRGAFVTGCSSEELITALQQKQAINFARKWPPSIPDVPTEYIRE
jgi:Protein of unknown function (DUF550)